MFFPTPWRRGLITLWLPGKLERSEGQRIECECYNGGRVFCKAIGAWQRSWPLGLGLKVSNRTSKRRIGEKFTVWFANIAP